jgi:hypothetical protein
MKKSSSVISNDSATSAPRPTPGKIYALFPCPGTKCIGFPAFVTMSTGSKGEPDAKTTFPSVHSYACVAVHSALDVGFDRAKISGF